MTCKVLLRLEVEEEPILISLAGPATFLENQTLIQFHCSTSRSTMNFAIFALSSQQSSVSVLLRPRFQLPWTFQTNLRIWN